LSPRRALSPVRGGARGASSVSNGAAADLQPFLQAFPNLGLFSPSFSKDSFGGFVEFQWFTIEYKLKSPLPNFFVFSLG
jgi:hypothetical protein